MSGARPAHPAAEAAHAAKVSATLVMLREILHAAIADILTRPQRSILSMLGIGVGVAAVVTVVSLVQGLSRSIADQFLSMGGSTLSVHADSPLQDALNGRRSRVTLADLEHLRRRVEGVRHVTPVLEVMGRGPNEVRHGSAVGRGRLLGTTARYQDVQQTYPRYGRFLTHSDDLYRRRVAVLGDKLRRDLKLPVDAIGRHITIGGEWFRVVGVMEPRGETLGINQDDYLLIPFHTALAISGTVGEPDITIHVAVAEIDATESVKQRIVALLRERHHIEPGQPNAFVVESSSTLLESFAKISLTVTLVVSGIVGVSLLVGGIGIMNVMLISVTERTREIGVAKALGAPSQYILGQFLLEAVMLSTLGGAVGAVSGWALALAIGRAIPEFPPPVLPWWTAVGAFMFAAAVGVVFGFAPARRASRLQPVEALRHE